MKNFQIEYFQDSKLFFISNFSGVRTPLGNIYTGALVIVSLLFLTPYFSFIPKATLAAIIIAAVVFMVEVKVIKPMWRSKSKLISPFQKYQVLNVCFTYFQKAT